MSQRQGEVNNGTTRSIIGSKVVTFGKMVGLLRQSTMVGEYEFGGHSCYKSFPYFPPFFGSYFV